MCELDRKLESFWKIEPQLRKSPQQVDLWTSLWVSFFIGGYCGQGSLTVGKDTIEQVVLSGIKRQAEQAVRNTSVSSIPPWFSLPLLLWLPSVMDCKLSDGINPLLPKLLLVMVFYRSN